MPSSEKYFHGLNKIKAAAEQQIRFAFDMDEVPVSAVIFTDDYEIISIAHNLVEKNCDVTAHAEILAIREAQQKIGSKYLNDLQIFVTLEPCAMCATAISYARLKRLFFAEQDSKFGAILNGTRLFETQNSLYIPEIYPDIGSSEAQKLLREFFANKRKG